MGYHESNAIETWGKKLLMRYFYRIGCEIVAVSEGFQPNQDYSFIRFKAFEDELVRLGKRHWLKCVQAHWAHPRSGEFYCVQSVEMKSQVYRPCRCGRSKLCECGANIKRDWSDCHFVEIAKALCGVLTDNATPAGVSATEATYWADIYPDGIYLYPRKLLLILLLRREKPLLPESYVVTAGDGNATGLNLYKEIVRQQLKPIVFKFSNGQREYLLRLVEEKERTGDEFDRALADARRASGSPRTADRLR